MDTHEAIKLLTARMERYHPSDKITEATKKAILALQKQAERENGCEYCDPEVMSGNPIFSRHADGYLGNGKFCTDAGVGVKAYFCPHCGRRLK